MIFVFGSNLSGRHGAGAALTAYRLHGAKMGVAEGREGNSYAIPTVDHYIRSTLPIPTIEKHVAHFIQYAKMLYEQSPQETFQITRVGCGLAGLRDHEIAPMFERAPITNCFIDQKWKIYLPKHESWGTF